MRATTGMPPGTLRSPRTCGGPGFGGQLFWVDPGREIAFVHLVVGDPQRYTARKRSQRSSGQVITALRHPSVR